MTCSCSWALSPCMAFSLGTALWAITSSPAARKGQALQLPGLRAIQTLSQRCTTTTDIWGQVKLQMEHCQCQSAAVLTGPMAFHVGKTEDDSLALCPIPRLSLENRGHGILVSCQMLAFHHVPANLSTAALSDRIHPWACLATSKWLFHYSAECSGLSMNNILLFHQLPHKEIKSGSNTGLVVRREEIRWGIS